MSLCLPSGLEEKVQNMSGSRRQVPSENQDNESSDATVLTCDGGVQDEMQSNIPAFDALMLETRVSDLQRTPILSNKHTKLSSKSGIEQERIYDTEKAFENQTSIDVDYKRDFQTKKLSVKNDRASSVNVHKMDNREMFTPELSDPALKGALPMSSCGIRKEKVLTPKSNPTDNADINNEPSECIPIILSVRGNATDLDVTDDISQTIHGDSVENSCSISTSFPSQSEGPLGKKLDNLNTEAGNVSQRDCITTNVSDTPAKTSCISSRENSNVLTVNLDAISEAPLNNSSTWSINSSVSNSSRKKHSLPPSIYMNRISVSQGCDSLSKISSNSHDELPADAEGAKCKEPVKKIQSKRVYSLLEPIKSPPPYGVSQTTCTITSSSFQGIISSSNLSSGCLRSGRISPCHSRLDELDPVNVSTSLEVLNPHTTILVRTQRTRVTTSSADETSMQSKQPACVIIQHDEQDGQSSSTQIGQPEPESPLCSYDLLPELRGMNRQEILASGLLRITKKPRTDLSKQHVCFVCGEEFHTKEFLQFHLTRKVFILTYFCRVCNKMCKFHNKCSFVEHILVEAVKREDMPLKIETSFMKLEPFLPPDAKATSHCCKSQSGQSVVLSHHQTTTTTTTTGFPYNKMLSSTTVIPLDQRISTTSIPDDQMTSTAVVPGDQRTSTKAVYSDQRLSTTVVYSDQRLSTAVVPIDQRLLTEVVTSTQRLSTNSVPGTISNQKISTVIVPLTQKILTSVIPSNREISTSISNHQLSTILVPSDHQITTIVSSGQQLSITVVPSDQSLSTSALSNDQRSSTTVVWCAQRSSTTIVPSTQISSTTVPCDQRPSTKVVSGDNGPSTTPALGVQGRSTTLALGVQIPSTTIAPCAKGPSTILVPGAQGPSTTLSPSAQGPSTTLAPGVQGPSTILVPGAQGPSTTLAPGVQGPSTILVPGAQGPSTTLALSAQGPSKTLTPGAQGPSTLLVPGAQGPSTIIVPGAQGLSAILVPGAQGPLTTLSPGAQGPSTTLVPGAQGPSTTVVAGDQTSLKAVVQSQIWRSTKNSCLFCNSNFLTFSGLKSHFQRVNNAATYCCTICQMELFNQCSLSAHCGIHHAENKYFVTCPECGETLPCSQDFKSLFEHLDSCGHFNVWYTIACACKETFTSAVTLKEHLLVKHLQVRYQCKICLLTRPSMYLMYLHFKNKHQNRMCTASVILLCCLCKRNFNNPTALRSHIDQKTDIFMQRKKKVYQCIICLEAFASASRLNSHLEQDHIHKPKRCTLCFGLFMGRQSLVNHLVSKSCPKTFPNLLHLCLDISSKREKMLDQSLYAKLFEVKSLDILPTGVVVSVQQDVVTASTVSSNSQSKAAVPLALCTFTLPQTEKNSDNCQTEKNSDYCETEKNSENSQIGENSENRQTEKNSENCQTQKNSENCQLKTSHKSVPFKLGSSTPKPSAYDRSKHQCHLCKICLVGSHNFIKHMSHHKAIDSQTGRSHCIVCKKMVAGSSISAHMEEHQNHGVIVCTLCHRRDFPSLNLARDHSKNWCYYKEVGGWGEDFLKKKLTPLAHAYGDSMENSQNNKDSVSDSRDLSASNSRSENEPLVFPCLMCGLAFLSKSTKDDHVSRVHDGTKTFFLCLVCKRRGTRKAFNKKQKASMHISRKHRIFDATAISKLILEEVLNISSGQVIPSDVSSQESLDEPAPKRLRQEAEGTFLCGKCGFSNGQWDVFEQHIKTHNPKGEPQCPECGLCFTVSVALKKHIFAVHRIKDVEEYMKRRGIEEENIEEVSSDEDCDIEVDVVPTVSEMEGCVDRPLKSDKTSKRKSISMNEIDSTLECNVCYRKFTSELVLKSHMRSHGMAFIRSRRDRNRDQNYVSQIESI